MFTCYEYIIWGVVGLLWAVQIAYLFLLYNPVNREARRRANLPKVEEPEVTTPADGQLSMFDTPAVRPLPGISVIIVACNQDIQLRENLPAILEQDYPKFEVIVVNDNSNDETCDVLQQMQSRYPHLRTTFTPETTRRISHRKLALTLGIKGARHEWLAFADIDSRPVSNQWLRSMTAHLVAADDRLISDVDTVFGYTGLEKSKGLGAALRRFDVMLTGMRLLGLGIRHKAHMALGSNLIYRRSIFFDNKGYSAHLDLERGEDDIFVNENILPTHICAEVSPESIIRSTETTRHHWQSEKLGRIATRRHLHGFMPFILSADTVTRALYVLLTAAAIVVAILMKWWITLGIIVFLWALRYAAQWSIFTRASRHLGENNYGPAMPLLDICQPAWELPLRARYLLSSKRAYHRKQI